MANRPIIEVFPQPKPKLQLQPKPKPKPKPRAEARIRPYLQDADTVWFVYNASLPEVERRARLRGSPVLHFVKGIEVLTAIGWCLFTSVERHTIFCLCKTSDEARAQAKARAKARGATPSRGSSPGPQTFTVSLVPRGA